MTGVHVRARLLGAFDVAVDGRPLDRAAFERPSGLRVLKLLLATPEHRVRREAAAELLWPEVDAGRSAGNLRKAIHFARRGLASAAHPAGEEIVLSDGDWLRIAPSTVLDVDADRLLVALDLLERGAPTREPGELEGHGATRDVGDPLAVVADLGGTELLPEDPYEEWLLPIRERLRQRVLAAALSGVAEARRRGDAALAARLADRALALDPADEAAHRALIDLHLEAGHLHAARRQLLACRRALADAYGVEPSSELVMLVDAAATARAVAAGGMIDEPEIIGRRLELERAEPVLDAVAAGRLGLLLIRGPAGIGKSRLLREVVRLAAAGGWRILELRGRELSADTAFAALGGALAATRESLGIEAWPEPARSATLTIAPSLRERTSSAPVVAFATDVGLRAGLIEGLRRLMAHRPLVLAVDDVQWLDAATLAWLRAALALAAPILVVVTLRDEPHPTDPALDGLVDDLAHAGVEIRVGPMGPREVELLLERELGADDLADAVGSSLVELAGGTPLYALQLLRAAQESGAIGLRDGQWRPTESAGSLPVPAGVLRVVEDRTERLAKSVRDILVVAAELGDEVSYEVLVAASGTDAETVLDALDEGLRLDLLVERAGRYRFGHPLFRAALRGGAPRRSRAQLHGRIAAALARDVDPADGAAIGAVIASGADALAVATHAADAVDLGAVGAIGLAVGFGFAAGTRQNALFDYVGSTATLHRALGLWYRLPAAMRTSFPPSAAQHQLGLALKALGDPAGAGDAFKAEIATATNDMDRARGFAALSWLPYEHGRFDRSAEILRDGIGAVEGGVARAFLESGLGWIRGRQGDWEAAYELLEPAVAVLEQGAPADLLARALDRFAVAIRDRGRPEQSIPVFRRALALSAEAADVHEEAIIRMHLASALRDAGDVAAGRDEVERSITLTRMTGDRYIEAVANWILAEVEDTAGRLDEAAAARRSELGILQASGGNPQNQAMAHAHLAHIAARASDQQGAAVEAETARALAAHAGLDYLPALVERALNASDWFRVSHRHAEGDDTGALSVSPGR